MPDVSQDPTAAIASRISDAVVALVREYTGRGPVGVRTTIDRDTVYVLMRDTLSKGEAVLVDHGHTEEVLAMRRAFQTSMRDDLRVVVERATARRVKAFMSANHTDPDCAVEVFVLGDATGPDDAPTGGAGTA